MEVTTIKIAPATRDRLKAFGRKGETYDQLLNRLLDQVQAHVVSLAEVRR
ncbi:MAG: hypothetical protein HY557_02540 [Euryarchaeota archaeon]|nr:hypothetical protein [Euryarchaeota archaeon]